MSSRPDSNQQTTGGGDNNNDNDDLKSEPILQFRRSADEFQRQASWPSNGNDEDVGLNDFANDDNPDDSSSLTANGTGGGGLGYNHRVPPLSQRRNFVQSVSAATATTSSANDADGCAQTTDNPRKISLPTGGVRGRQSRRNSRSIGPDGDFGRQQTATDEEGVEREAESVVHSFFVSSQMLDQRHEMGEFESIEMEALTPASAGTPHIPELNHFADDQNSPTVIIGRRLAHFGDEFQQQYQHELDSMVQLLLPQILSVNTARMMLSEAYEAFRKVASQIFEAGINWGRVISLLAFGYRMSVALFERGVRGFVGTVVRLVVRFIVGERIASWIALQGGWASSFDYRMDDMLPVGWFGTTLSVAYKLFSAAVVISFVYHLLKPNK